MNLLVNNVARSIKAEPETPLLWVLREELDLTGTKYGCGLGVCGICMVHIEGVAVQSCVIPIGQIEGAVITTIEGLPTDGIFSAVQQAWLDEGVSQCGYCQPGIVMSLIALLSETPLPSEAELVAGLKTLCRCGSYAAMRRAIRRVLK